MSFLPRFNELHARDKSRRKRAGAVRTLTILAVIAVGVVLGKDAFSPMMRDATAPLMGLASSVSAVEAIEGVVVSKESLQKERDALLTRIGDLEYQSLLADTLRQENIELRTLLNASLPENGVTAKILVRPDRSAYDTLVIDRGEASGIAVGDIALASGSVAFGVVREVGQATALIELYSSPEKTTDVVLADGTILVAEGKGGGMFSAEAAHDVPVTLGDTVSLSGSSQPFAFARVTDITGSPADPFKTIRFSNPVNFYTLRFVTLIKNPH
jgi:cell shape-determining protein MreC